MLTCVLKPVGLALTGHRVSLIPWLNLKARYRLHEVAPACQAVGSELQRFATPQPSSACLSAAGSLLQRGPLHLSQVVPASVQQGACSNEVRYTSPKVVPLAFQGRGHRPTVRCTVYKTTPWRLWFFPGSSDPEIFFSTTILSFLLLTGLVVKS